MERKDEEMKRKRNIYWLIAIKNFTVHEFLFVSIYKVISCYSKRWTIFSVSNDVITSVFRGIFTEERDTMTQNVVIYQKLTKVIYIKIALKMQVTIQTQRESNVWTKLENNKQCHWIINGIPWIFSRFFL